MREAAPFETSDRLVEAIGRALGPRADAGDRARIFQRFERAVTRREHGGFGIGLWLANQLVVAMGGAIGVESRPGEGTTLTVSLPLGDAEQSDGRGA